ncbi:hypothetical protein FNB15_18225 [Ferrovibrio terrae]|uniref:Uncharacterized protein n=1 Tax=Ferrovibrio terrae TaxID=2594003 RepID=A0A516H5P8_9PROT|nr:hypothetical protein [Ferrovibrio terrae]QDO99086.1 hypothetical protein FNB15_18225 [Ferrovibrio terrae]
MTTGDAITEDLKKSRAAFFEALERCVSQLRAGDSFFDMPEFQAACERWRIDVDEAARRRLEAHVSRLATRRHPPATNQIH